MMKILMLGWELPPHNSGGLGVACLHLSKALAKRGAKIDFIVPYSAKHEEIDFMKVHSAMKIDPLFKWGIGAYDSFAVNEQSFISEDGAMMSIRQIQRNYCQFIDEFLSENHPDLVHAHDWLTYEAGILAKKKFGVPLIAHVHATEYDRSGAGGGNPIVTAIEREGLMMADKILAVSENTRRIIHEKYDIPLDKIDVVYNSLGDDYLNDGYIYDDNDYKYLEMLKAEGYKVVTTVGRLTVQKGLTHLMRAAAKALKINPKLIFVLAGDGEQRAELMNLVADLGIAPNVIFTGFIRGQKLRDIYSISDVFVMSSVSEPFGLTALEAAHHGNALILTKQSGVAEILHATMEYDFWDENKLVDEILAVTSSRALSGTLKNSIKREYHKISWDDVAKKCMSVYNRLERNMRER